MDHVDRDKLNNRKSNLRRATRSQNSCNMSGWGPTGVKGVYKNILSGTFRVNITKMEVHHRPKVV